MFTEREAYEGKKANVSFIVTNGRRLKLDCIPRDVPKEIHSLIKSGWDQEAAKRPGFSELSAKLRPFLFGPKEEARVKDAVETVLTEYHRDSSGSVQQATHLEDSDHCQKITRAHYTLCEFIRNLDAILDGLLQGRAVTTKEREIVRSTKPEYEWTNCLLDILAAKPVSAYTSFLEALRATNQHHLYLLLEDKDYQMNVDHRVTLIDNFTYLKDNITLTDSALLDTLLQADVLNPREVTEIKSKPTDHERTDQLLQYILRTSSEQYQLFLEALNKSSHEHVFTKLKGEDSQGDEMLESNSSVHVIPTTGEQIRGIAVLDHEVFVVRGTAEVNAYNTRNFTASNNIMICVSHKLHSLISCAHYNCLYLYDKNQKTIHRYAMSDKATTNWSVGGLCYGLSVTGSYNVLVTLHDTKQVREYTSSGSLVREISLNLTGTPYHCVELSTGNFVLAYFRVQNSISIVDPSGNVIQSYGSSVESGGSGLFFPRHLDVDKCDNVMVADRDSNRVMLLSPALTYKKDIEMPDHMLSEPCVLYFNEQNHRLFIGEFTAGRIFVLPLSHID